MEKPAAPVKRHIVRNSVLGTLLCTTASILITAAFRVAAWLPNSEDVPLLFLLVVGMVAWIFGTRAAVFGLLSGCLVFSIFLFQPFGSLRVGEEPARVNLVMMLLFGLAIAYFYGKSDSSERDVGGPRGPATS